MSSLYTNGQPTPSSSAIPPVVLAGQYVARHAARQLRRIARELAGTRPYKPRKRRVLYKQAHNLSDVDVDVIVAEIGASRVLEALDRFTAPELPLVAAE